MVIHLFFLSLLQFKCMNFQNYSLSFHLLNGYITNSHNDQLPVGLIAQLVYISTALISLRSWVRIPFKPELIFFRLSFPNCLSCVYTAIIHLFIVSSAVQMYEFSYIHFQEMCIYLIDECCSINKNLFISLGIFICHNSYNFSPIFNTYRKKSSHLK